MGLSQTKSKLCEYVENPSEYSKPVIRLWEVSLHFYSAHTQANVVLIKMLPLQPLHFQPHKY